MTSELTDDLIGRYWDQTGIGADRYPDDATREYHRANYIKAVRANPEALAQLTLTFRRRGMGGFYTALTCTIVDYDSHAETGKAVPDGL